MDHQASSLYNQDFDHEGFTEQYKNGWLKYYLCTVIIFFFIGIINLTRTLKLGVYYLGNPLLKTNDGENYNTILYGLSLLLIAGLATLLPLGLFIQYQAFRLKSLSKQWSCLNIFAIFTISQAGAALFNIFCSAITEPISFLSTILIGVVPFVIGMICSFLAFKVLDLMLGPEDEPFKFDEFPLQVEVHMI